MLKLKCPVCGKDFIVNSVNTLEETLWCTMDCSNCNSLLISVPKEGILSFHEYIHKTEPSWPKDGKGTYYTEF